VRDNDLSRDVTSHSLHLPTIPERDSQAELTGHPFVGRRNKYKPKGGVAPRLGVGTRNGWWVAGKTVFCGTVFLDQ